MTGSGSPQQDADLDLSGRWTRLLVRWVRTVESAPGRVIAILLILTAVASVIAVQRFAIDSDLDKLIDPDESLAWNIADQRYKAAFPQMLHTVVVVVSGNSLDAVGDGTAALAAGFRGSALFSSVFAPTQDGFLRDHALYYLPVDELEAVLGRIADAQPAIARVNQDPTLNGLFGLLEDGLRSRPLPDSLLELLNRVADSAEAVAEGRDGTVRWMDTMLGDDGTQTHYQLIVLQGVRDFGASLPNQVLLDEVRGIISETPTPPATQVRITGELALQHEEIQAGQKGIALAGTVSLVLLTLILVLGVRSFRVVGAILSMLLIGIAWTSCFASLTVGAYNTLSLMFLVMFFGLGVDFAIHFCLRIQEARIREEESAQPIIAAVRGSGAAISLCTVTSAIAFMAFIPTDYRGLAELGIISAGGMAIALLLTFTWIPAVFCRFGLPRPLVMPRVTGSDRALGAELRHRRGVLMGALIIAAGSLFLAVQLRFDFSVLAIRDRDSESMSTLLELQDAGVVTHYAAVVMMDDPAAIPDLEAELLALDQVAGVRSGLDLVPTDQEDKQFLIDDTLTLMWTALSPVGNKTPDRDRVSAARGLLTSGEGFLQGTSPTEQAVVRRLLAAIGPFAGNDQALRELEHALLDELLEDLDWLRQALQATPFEFADLPEDLRRRWVSADGVWQVNAVATGDVTDVAALERFVHAVSEVAPNPAGRPVVEWGIGQTVVDSFGQAISTALIAILVLLMLELGHIGRALLVTVPLALATICTFAVAAVGGLSINMANILVVPLIFGLGVDTGIHVVHRFFSERDLPSAVHSSTPRAIVLSALTTIGTFISLGLSPHAGAASVGHLLTIAIGLLLIFTLLVLPALLVTIYGESGPPGSGAGTKHSEPISR